MAVQTYFSGDSAVKIAASVEHALTAGRLAGGEPLPPVRVLASHLSVSPATVASAYRLLQDRGIAVSDGRRGTRLRHVSPALPPVPTDLPHGVRDLAADEGLEPAALREALRGTAGALIVTPRAQNPTGAALSERRARQLRTLLRDKPDLFVIEDDHAGPVSGAAYRTISSDRERWAVVRSVSKSLGPDLRVALVAGDARTVARVEGRQNLGIRWVSHILQQLVASLWRDKSVQKRLVMAARVYSERRHALLEALHARGLAAHGAS